MSDFLRGNVFLAGLSFYPFLTPSPGVSLPLCLMSWIAILAPLAIFATISPVRCLVPSPVSLSVDLLVISIMRCTARTTPGCAALALLGPLFGLFLLCLLQYLALCNKLPLELFYLGFEVSELCLIRFSHQRFGEERHVCHKAFSLLDLNVEFVLVVDCGPGFDHREVLPLGEQVELLVFGVNRISEASELVGQAEVQKLIASQVAISESLLHLFCVLEGLDLVRICHDL